MAKHNESTRNGTSSKSTAYVAACQVNVTGKLGVVPKEDFLLPITTAANDVLHHLRLFLPIEGGMNSHCSKDLYNNHVAYAHAVSLSQKLLDILEKRFNYGTESQPHEGNKTIANLSLQENCAVRASLMIARQLVGWFLKNPTSKPGPIASIPKSLFSELEHCCKTLSEISGSRAIPECSGEQSGVSLQDAAGILEPQDPDARKVYVRTWQNSTNPKLPAPIGKCPRHSQRNLYKPTELIGFLKKIEGLEKSQSENLRAAFLRIKRDPRQ